MTETEYQKAIDLACNPPEPVSAAGAIGDTANRVAQVATITKAVVGQLKVKGLSLGEILNVIALIGYFIAEHGDDIQAIVDKVLVLFGKK